MKNFKTLENEFLKVEKSKKAESNFNYVTITEFQKMSDEERAIYHKKRELYNSEVMEIKKYNEDLEIKKAVIKHNLKCVMYENVKPVLVELINKYHGKPFGEITTEKFKQEFKEKTGYAMYFDKNFQYSDSIKVYLLNDKGYKSYIIDNITINFDFFQDDSKDTKIFNDSNRLKEVSPENLSCIYNKNEYIEDIKKYIRDYKKAYKKAQEAQEKLRKSLSEYREIKVEGLESLAESRTIYPKY